MKLSDIVTLLKAGYSKSEINDLSKLEESNNPESSETDLVGKMNDIITKMNDIETRLNADNISKTEVNEINNIDPAEVLAGMIR